MQCAVIECNGNGQSGGYGLYVTTSWNSPGKIGIDVYQATPYTGGPALRAYSAASNGVEGRAGYEWVSGVYGEHNASGYGVAGRSSVYGVAVLGDNPSWSYGWAGYFTGRVYVAGYLFKAGGGFLIDHPNDPANKYLAHSFVESPDMKNLYDGIVVLGDQGRAVVQLPSYFEAANKEIRYQLTPLGAAASLYVSRELSGGSFEIAGGRAGLKVSWMVTGVRNDPVARNNRIQNEIDKLPENKGRYLNPEAFQQPESMREIGPRRPKPFQPPSSGGTP